MSQVLRAQPRGAATAEKELRILIVEDMPTDVELLEYELRRAGVAFTSKTVETEEAFLKALDEFVPDLIVSDYSLPAFDGMRALQLAKERAPHVPVIIATAPKNEETAVECMKAGAADYVIKDRLLRIGPALMGALANQWSQEEKERAEKSLRAVEHGFRVAREIQQGLFPKTAPEFAGLDIAGASYPAEATGGDYFDYVPMPDGSVVIVIGDVSGHGFGPALLMADTRAYLRALLQTQEEIGEVLHLIKGLLMSDLGENYFVTLILAKLDPAARTLVYASAGHETAYVLDGSGGVKEAMKSTGPLLSAGVKKDLFLSHKIQLAPGDLVCLLTDGVLEALSPEGTEFGTERTLETVQANRGRPACEIVEVLHDEIAAFCRHRPQLDDITAVIIKVGEAS